jgi:shikimate kinase
MKPPSSFISTLQISIAATTGHVTSITHSIIPVVAGLISSSAPVVPP